VYNIIYVTTYLVRNTRVEVVFAADEFVVGCCARWRQYRLCDHVNRMPCTESAARWLAYKTVILYTAHSYRAAAAAANDNALSALRPRRSSSYSSTSSLRLPSRRPTPTPTHCLDENFFFKFICYPYSWYSVYSRPRYHHYSSVILYRRIDILSQSY